MVPSVRARYGRVQRQALGPLLLAANLLSGLEQITLRGDPAGADPDRKTPDISDEVPGKIQHPANVHFTPEGSQQLAKQVARQVEAALADR